MMGLVIILILAGLIFMLAEILIFPGVGISGILGVASLAGGCWYTFDKFGNTAGVVVICICLVLIIAAVIISLRAKTWNKLALKTKIVSKAGQDQTEVSVGDKGLTITRLAPMGTARINGKTYEVKAVKGMLDAEEEVEVSMIDDGKIYVRKLN